MTDKRYKKIMEDVMSPNPTGVSLTKQEINEGWHFCYEWDGLLVGPRSEELFCCKGLPKNPSLYKKK